jgi:hypothetical protein
MFGFIVLKDFNIIWFFNFPTLRVPEDDYSRNTPGALRVMVFNATFNNNSVISGD